MCFFFLSISLEKSIKDEKVYFIKGNELKLTEFELLSFFYFKRIIFVANYKLRELAFMFASNVSRLSVRPFKTTVECRVPRPVETRTKMNMQILG